MSTHSPRVGRRNPMARQPAGKSRLPTPSAKSVPVSCGIGTPPTAPSRGRSARAAWPQLLLFALVAALPACESIRAMARPTARITHVRPRDLSLAWAMLDFDVEVANPYGVPLPLADLDYRLASAGKAFASGHAPISGSVPARGSKVVTVPVRVVFADLLAAIQSIQPGAVVPYQAELGLSVNAPVVGPLRLDLAKSGEVPIPAVPEVSLDRVAWDDLSLDRAGGTMHLRVKNTNSFPVDLTKLRYELALGGTQVALSSVEQQTRFDPGSESTIQLPISISPRKLGIAVFNLLTGNGSGYALEGDLDLDTPFGAIRVPYEKRGQTTFSR